MSRALVALALAACAARPNAELHGAWSEPVAPYHVVGNIYYVGARHIAAYLIATPAGHILIDSGTREMLPVVRANIAALGFAVRDVRVLLCTHAHFDHVQNHAALARETGAQVVAMRADAPALASGVDRSPLHGEGWAPVHIDRVIDDGDTVSLGGTTLTAILAPGHTPGCTVWTTRTAGLAVAFYGCVRPNDGVALTPALIDQTLHTFARMRTLAPDLYLTMHPPDEFVRPDPKPDPAAWPKLLDAAEAEFRRLAGRRASYRSRYRASWRAWSLRRASSAARCARRGRCHRRAARA